MTGDRISDNRMWQFLQGASLLFLGALGTQLWSMNATLAAVDSKTTAQGENIRDLSNRVTALEGAFAGFLAQRAAEGK